MISGLFGSLSEGADTKISGFAMFLHPFDLLTLLRPATVTAPLAFRVRVAIALEARHEDHLE